MVAVAAGLMPLVAVVEVVAQEEMPQALLQLRQQVRQVVFVQQLQYPVGLHRYFLLITEVVVAHHLEQLQLPLQELHHT